MLWATLLLLPWLFLGLVAPFRLRRRPLLRDEPAVEGPDAPLVSVIIPARDEAENIAACMATVIASKYARRELIVVDDRSVDGTAEVARAIAGRSPIPVQVVEGEPLPAGWIGKPWACAQGAARARGELLVFTDADCRHDDDLLGHAVGALRRSGAQLVTAAGRQLLLGFWERLLMPHVLALLWLRWRDPGQLQRVQRPRDAFAAGHFILVPRSVYDAFGGHEAVRAEVVEDLAIAQRVVAGGGRLFLGLAEDLLETRMYHDLHEITEGWSKNLATGSRMTTDPWIRPLLPWLLVAFILAAWVLPPILLLVALFAPVGSALLAWSAGATLAGLWFWVVVRARYRAHPHFALLYPLGAAIVAGIVTRSARIGRHFAWKGRQYGDHLDARGATRGT